MEGSLERIRAMFAHRKPDRIPLYELIRNDAVVKHFTGRDLTPENAEEVLYETFPKAVDTTRSIRRPSHENDEILPDGRRRLTRRWTIWTEHVKYASSEAYAEAKRAALAKPMDTWTKEDQAGIERHLANLRELRRRLGPNFFHFAGGPSLGLMGIMGEVGVEAFCYYLADYPDVMDLQLEWHMVRSILWLEHLPKDHGLEAVFTGDDIAFKNGPFLSPAWFREHYMPRFKPIMEAYHRRGILANFHSDGNLMPIMDQLVEAGIDMLNPIEVAAGMDIAELHRRYPALIFTGGIDVSGLLPFGAPEEVRDATVKAIEDAEGQIMIGSSTELHNHVPLANFLAMRQAALDYRL